MFKQISISVLLALSFSLHAAEVSIRADEWYPFNGDPSSKMPGFMIEIAETILKKHGHTVDYKNMPWERSIDMVRKGKFDCVVGATEDETPDFVFPTVSLGQDSTKFFAKNDSNWKYNGVDSLKLVRLALISGYDYGDEISNYVEAQKGTDRVQMLSGNNALDQNIKKLLAGRLDVVAESPMVMNAKLQEMKLSGKLIAVGDLDEPYDLYIACSPAKQSSKVYAELLSKGMDELRASGELKAILDKYGLEDWVE